MMLLGMAGQARAPRQEWIAHASTIGLLFFFGREDNASSNSFFFFNELMAMEKLRLKFWNLKSNF
jgi:hypothetical protein